MNFVIQDFVHLILCDPWKPRQKLGDRRPITQVLEERSHGDACAAKTPGATQDFRRTLDRSEALK